VGELCADGSVATLETAPVTIENRPEGVKGRLFDFATKHLSGCQGRTYGELEQCVRDEVYAHRGQLPYPPDVATVKILNRWQSVDEDGNFVVRPNFAYCS
jgi:hypothetical protein